MGGKSYFCDYCRCYMKNDIKLRKTHNEGLAHTIMKVAIMRRYEDPRKLYEEEIAKQPCMRYFKGYCKYDLYCRNTHFSEKQLKQLKELVVILDCKEATNSLAKPNVSRKFRDISKLPWINNITKKNLKLLPKKLPPSLKPLSLTKLSRLDISNNKWG
ncbi:hypothetical protein DOY81_000437 [Sarcophaga bullata]|nr:hypothetical protein DOY81_000437 [Sarcophaga bullata]